MNLSLLVATAIVVVGAADVGLTIWALELGLRETNRWMRVAQERLGKMWVLPKLALHLLAAWLVWQYVEDIALIVVAILIGLYVVVLRNKWRQIKDKK
jgi:hypothetical protein